MFRTLMQWLLLIMAGYLLLVALLWLFQGRLIHLPSQALVATPADIGLRYRDVEIDTDDGERLHGWYLPGEPGSATLLFLHGNAGNISHRLDSLALFHELGLSVLIIDYRGYGRSSGSPNERGLYRDGEAALAYLLGRLNVPASKILLFGRSLGAAVAARLASRHSVGGLILESAFTSATDMAAELYPWLPARLLVRYRYDTARYLQGVTAPVLIIHSRDDEIVPFRHAERLYRIGSAPGPCCRSKATTIRAF
ncbi:alpha/beta hydrolase [Marinobacterium aestuariivivens]|uniref:Alpha/beta hydrolase n=1 Tax=Marinobacterium aestuariivivens TaxID=1698799 RepID=A0ABW2A401_9GAMM